MPYTPPPKSLPNISYKVTYREITQLDLVVRAWGEHWAEDDHGVYEFRNGKQYDSTDKGVTGIYGKVPVVLDSIILQNFYPDAPAHLVQQGVDADGKATKWKIRFQTSPRLEPTASVMLDANGNPFILGTSKLG